MTQLKTKSRRPRPGNPKWTALSRQRAAAQMLVDVAALERFAYIAIDLAETTRKIRHRPLLPSEAKPFIWLLLAFEETHIQREIESLPASKQGQLFRLIVDLTLALDRR